MGGKKADYDSVAFPSKLIQNIELIDQNPIGKSSRSNPVTYLKAYDDIRDLFAKQKSAKVQGLKPKHFSFNVDGGRCDECKGDGVITVSMQFMADIELECEHCHGTRFKKEILEIKYDEKNISDILHMTVDEALEFFKENQENSNQIKTSSGCWFRLSSIRSIFFHTFRWRSAESKVGVFPCERCDYR
jgi:excinuclease ABC subunit A